ncbi:MAG TPA: BamA/TamA family outer membrane protein [Sphingomonas sp.]
MRSGKRDYSGIAAPSATRRCLQALSGTLLLLSVTPPWASANAAPPQPAQAVDPLTDPSFDAALPPLDGIAAPPASGAPEPAAAAAPPPADPALSRPLPPLAGFDPRPDTDKAAVPSGEAARIRYSVKVEGLDKIGLTAQFRALSALETGKKKAANAAQVSARAAADVQLAGRMMQAEGYYDGVATSTVLPVPGEAGQVAVTISATPGPRYAFSAIAITGAPPEPAAIARRALPFKPGDPIVAADIEGAEANVALTLPEKGYPFAKVGQRDILLDDAAHAGDYTLPLDAGAKSSFGGLRTEGDPIFTLRHLGVFPRFKAGDPYDSDKSDDLRQALVATGLFSTIAVEPVDTGRKAADGTEIVDLMVTQEKGPWRTLAGTGGYGTGEGIKATGSWTNRNRFSPEGSLTGTITAGNLEQGAGLTFSRKDAGQRDRTFSVALNADRTNVDAYEANTLDLSVSLARVSTPLWQKRWTWSFGGELVGTNEQGAATSATSDRPRRNYLIAALPMQVGYDRSDSLLDPTRGYRITLRVSPEASVRKGVKPYARATGQATGYYPIGKSIVLAGRVLVSSIAGVNDITEVAPSRRIYAGGGGSVRGFGYQQLGPKDAQNNPIGGFTSTEFAAEMRYRFGNFGIVPFFDGGRVGETSTPGIGGMRYGAGIGGRYYTNFGPMRIDVATPVNRQRGESRIALYISIGQAF